MVKLNLEYKEKLFIKYLAALQVESYNRIISQREHLNSKLIDQGMNISNEDIILQCVELHAVYDQIQIDPDILFDSKPDILINVKELILNFDDDFRPDYGETPAKLCYKIELAIYIHDHIN